MQILILPSGLEVPWIPTMESVGTTILIGAQEETIEVSGNVRLSYFITADIDTLTADATVVLCDNSSSRPRAGQKPQFRGKTHRVLKVAQDASGAYLKLFLGSGR